MEMRMKDKKTNCTNASHHWVADSEGGGDDWDEEWRWEWKTKKGQRDGGYENENHLETKMFEAAEASKYPPEADHKDIYYGQDYLKVLKVMVRSC